MQETFIAFLIWASAGAILARSGADPIQTALWRYSLAGFILVSAAVILKKFKPGSVSEWKVPWRDPRIWISGLLMVVGNIFFNISVSRGPVAIAGLVYGNIPVVVPLISFFCGLESRTPLTIWNWCGFLIAFTGNYLLFKGLFHVQIEIGESVLAALLAAICFGLGPVFTAALQSRNVRDWGLLKGQTATAMILALPIAWILFQFRFLNFSDPVVASKSFGMGIFGAIVLTILPFYLWYRGIRRVGPARTTMFVFLNPLLACLYSMLIAGDLPINWLTGPGVGFLIVGMFLNLRESGS